MSQQEGQQRKLRSRAITSHEEKNETTSSEGGSQELEKQFKCAICQNVLSNPCIISECCHRFCCNCIHAYMNAGNKECPTCHIHIASRQSLRRDELFGKLLKRLLKVRSQVEMMRSKRIRSTTLPSENEETSEIDEQGLNEQEERQNVLVGSKKRMFNVHEKSGQTHKKRKRPNSTFENHVKNLQKFKEENGHCNVPKGYNDNPPLGSWVRNVRATYKQIQLGKKTNGTLTQPRIKQLEDMGFNWGLFENSIAKLQKFKEEHGHCNVPYHYKHDPSLGHWVSQMRIAYNKIQLGKKVRTNLAQTKIEQLEKMGFQWKFVNPSLDQNIIKLQQFKEKHGHCNVPGNSSLGQWVRDMRSAYKQIKLGKKTRRNLPQSKIEQLEKIGIKWEIHQSFDMQITKLQCFKEEHGHCNVPNRYEDDPSLGYWIGHLRTAYKQIQLGKKPRQGLTQANIERLDKMGFQWQLRKSQSKA